MFEDSVFASRRQQRSGRTRWAVVGALGVQGLVMAAVMIVPMLRPEILPVVSAAPIVDLVALRKVVQPKVEIKPKGVAAIATGLSTPTASPAPMLTPSFGSGRMTNPAPSGEGPAVTMGGPVMGNGTGLPSGTLSGPAGPLVVVRPNPGKVRITSGVSAGLLLAPIHVVYPQIAKAAKVEGTVMVTATIDKTGRIVGVQSISGPAMLRGAAVDAVKEARYKPYLLNGEATEVETTVQVNFRLGS